jgi:hypothetical protein
MEWVIAYGPAATCGNPGVVDLRPGVSLIGGFPKSGGAIGKEPVVIRRSDGEIVDLLSAGWGRNGLPNIGGRGQRRERKHDAERFHGEHVALTFFGSKAEGDLEDEADFALESTRVHLAEGRGNRTRRHGSK